MRIDEPGRPLVVELRQSAEFPECPGSIFARGHDAIRKTGHYLRFAPHQIRRVNPRLAQGVQRFSLNNSSGRLAGVAGAEQALGFWYDLVAEAGSTGANGVRTRHAARYGDFAEFASGRRQAG